MHFLLMLSVILLISCSDRALEEDSFNFTKGEQDTVLLFVRIPDPMMPLERAEKYEEPLNDFLIANALGEVSGGGSMVSKPKDDGKRHIEWIGVDVDIYDPDKALPLVIEELKKLGVPKGTVIEQTEPDCRTINVW